MISDVQRSAAGASSSTFWAEILGILSSRGPPLPYFLREKMLMVEEEGGQEGVEGEGEKPIQGGDGGEGGAASSSSTSSSTMKKKEEEEISAAIEGE